MEKLLDCVMDIGEQMMISGAEVNRVEDSLERIFAAYGTKRTDVFIITSCMIVTIHDKDDKIYTQTRCITDSSSDYEKLHRLNELSRGICANRYSTEEIKMRLSEITSAKHYPLWLEFICYAVISGAFTLFFGGGPAEAAVSFLIGLFIRLAVLVCDKTVRNKIFGKFLSSLLATFLALLAIRLGIIPLVDKVIIGSIMTLISGIGLTTALKDLLVGDSIAGLLRTIEACITAIAIAAGYFTIAFLTGGAI